MRYIVGEVLSLGGQAFSAFSLDGTCEEETSGSGDCSKFSKWTTWGLPQGINLVSKGPAHRALMSCKQDRLCKMGLGEREAEWREDLSNLCGAEQGWQLPGAGAGTWRGGGPGRHGSGGCCLSYTSPVPENNCCLFQRVAEEAGTCSVRQRRSWLRLALNP